MSSTSFSQRDSDKRAATSITLTELDHNRLRQMIDCSLMSAPGEIAPPIMLLSRALMKARVVAPREISRKVATINSFVVYGVLGPPGIPRFDRITLVPPADADVHLGRVSVLSAIGSALLGLAEGQSIDRPDEAGRPLRYTLLEVVFQPEAVGRFDL